MSEEKNVFESTEEVSPEDSEWELEGEEGETLDPDSPEMIAERRAAGDPTAPEEGS